MIPIKEQIKKLRKKLEMTQQEFADKLGIKRNNIAGYETGTRNPSDSVVSLICREFNVNESWLSNGSGEMFLSQSRTEEIEKIVKDLLRDENDTFKTRFITMLSRLSESDWERLEKEAMFLLDSKKEKEYTDLENKTVAELEAEYKKSRSLAAKKMGLSASNTTVDTSNKVANQ